MQVCVQFECVYVCDQMYVFSFVCMASAARLLVELHGLL